MNISTVWLLLLKTTDCVIMTFPILSEHSSILVPLLPIAVWFERGSAIASVHRSHNVNLIKQGRLITL